MPKTALILLTLLTALRICAPAEEGVREMWTDRPDQTESPFTVPQGWVQLESSLLSYTRGLGESERAEAFEWGGFNLKLGLTNNADLQLGFAPYIDDRLGGQRVADGIGEVTLRLKWNLKGNDEGSLSIAVMPYVKAPSASEGLGNGAWEGGLIVPVTFKLSETWSLGTMVFTGFNVNDFGNHRLEPGASASLGHDLTEKLGYYAEFFCQWTAGSKRSWQLALDTGMTYALSENLQLDAGLNWFFEGDRRLNPFVGFSVRF